MRANFASMQGMVWAMYMCGTYRWSYILLVVASMAKVFVWLFPLSKCQYLVPSSLLKRHKQLKSTPCNSAVQPVHQDVKHQCVQQARFKLRQPCLIPTRGRRYTNPKLYCYSNCSRRRAQFPSPSKDRQVSIVTLQRLHVDTMDMESCLLWSTLACNRPTV